MSNRNNIKVTKKPVFCTEQTKSGRIKATYTVEINGETFTSVTEGKTEAEAFSSLKERYTRSIKNSQYGEGLLGSYHPDDILGDPQKVRPDQVMQRQTAAEKPESETEESTASAQSYGTDEEPSKNMIKGKPRNHVPWQTNSQAMPYDGQGDYELKEPNPSPFLRPGDKLVGGMNNTSIVFGRDHGPDNRQVYSKSSLERQYNSGLSDHMGAGSIDIVAGRMAPFPLESIAGQPIVLAPCFNTSFPPNLVNVDLEGGKHPGMVMDAARIYISQMTTIDENFSISRRIPGADEVVSAVSPTSGIMLKADKLRMHARQDIKIVTGGPDEAYNSQGNRIRQANGIHLIAENGITLEGEEIPQQPMVLGDNLVECLKSMLKLISEVSQRLDHFVDLQNRFNGITSTSFHLMPVPSGITVPNPHEVWSGAVSVLEGLNNRLDAFKTEINNLNKHTTYLEKSNEKYICSNYNTVN